MSRSPRKHVSFRELTSSYTPAKRNNERFDLWLYHVGRRLSWPVAWLAVNAGVPATTITFISAGFVWIGAILIATGGIRMQLAGALLFQLWIIFDCADGTIARSTGTGSKRGEYADAFGGYSVSLLLYTSMGVAAFREVLGLVDPQQTLAAAESLMRTERVLHALGVLLAGVGGSLFSLYARLLYQKFLNIFEDAAKRVRPIKPRDDRGNPVMIAAQNVAANSGLALPLAVAAVATRTTAFYALFYCGVNAAMLALTVRRTLTRRASEALASASVAMDVAGPGGASARDHDTEPL